MLVWPFTWTLLDNILSNMIYLRAVSMNAHILMVQHNFTYMNTNDSYSWFSLGPLCIPNMPNVTRALQETLIIYLNLARN